MNSEQEKERKFFKIISRFFISKEFLFVPNFCKRKIYKMYNESGFVIKKFKRDRPDNSCGINHVHKKRQM